MQKADKEMDLINELGKIDTIEKAKVIFEQYMDEKHLSRILKIKNSEVLIRIANSIVLCNPRSIFVNTGSSEDLKFIKNLSIEKGEESPLAMEGHTIHFDLAGEQGRIVDRTYYIANPEDHVSSL
ncbi:MAG: phosphoenolpyruvate carboxykinase, partial [Thermodesulfobacteriota bacterium]